MHWESSPEFLSTPERHPVHPSMSSIPKDGSGILPVHPPPSSPQRHQHHYQQPSTLVKDGLMEVKIEGVNMQLSGKRTPPGLVSASVSLSSQALPTFSGIWPPTKDTTTSGSLPVLGCGSGKVFNEEKHKFIMEAQNWSKQVDTNIAKKIKETTSLNSPPLLPPPGSSSIGSNFPLGLFPPPQLVGNPPSLSSKCSPEEQEKLLRKHFEKILQQQQHQQQQQQQLLSMAASPSVPVAVSSKSPHREAGLSISTAGNTTTLGYTHSPHPSMGAAGAVASLSHVTHQPHPLVGSNHSPKKTSPLVPFQSSHAAATSMFPFLGQTSSATAAAASFLPSLSQFPMAAAMFSPLYQATLQQLMAAQQVKGSNIPIVPDPALIQGLIDSAPMVLPDGRVAYVPMGSTGQRGNVENPTEEEDEEEREEGSSCHLTPGHKRTRSPGLSVRSDFNPQPSKRRRSTSLPDITQLFQVAPTKKLVEGEHNKITAAETVGEQKSNGMVTVMATSASSPHPQQHAPPSIIHIPQDVKVNEHMVGFPTPSQGMVGNFSLAPLILPSSPYLSHHHQPHHHQPLPPGQDQLHNAEELRDLVEVGVLPAMLPPLPEGANLPQCKSEH